ncbi:hypothetical protein Tco_0702806 [Tanacetum coccineum]|uniref:Uncharacterized protein n=1 Tax=Tanacetum coccineum TaxID=301880 RepID=A0ABQ4XY49_9ASTR
MSLSILIYSPFHRGHCPSPSGKTLFAGSDVAYWHLIQNEAYRLEPFLSGVTSRTDSSVSHSESLPMLAVMSKSLAVKALVLFLEFWKKFEGVVGSKLFGDLIALVSSVDALGRVEEIACMMVAFDPLRNVSTACDMRLAMSFLCLIIVTNLDHSELKL